MAPPLSNSHSPRLETKLKGLHCYHPPKKAALLRPSDLLRLVEQLAINHDDLYGHDPGGLCARDDPADRLRYDGDHVTSHSAIRVRLLQSKLLRK